MTTIVMTQEEVDALLFFDHRGLIVHPRAGDVYDDDGWIYGKSETSPHDGVKRRKWLKRIGRNDTILWMPRLKEIAALEAKRWKMLQTVESESHNPVTFKKVLSRIKAEAPFFAWFDNFGQNEQGGWIEFYHPKEVSGGVCWTWWRHDGRNIEVDEHDQSKPPGKVRQDIADLYFRWEHRNTELWSRYGKFKHVFRMAVDEAYREEMYKRRHANDPKKKPFMLMTINGRNYWFETSPRGEYMLECTCWPEDTSHLRIKL